MSQASLLSSQIAAHYENEQLLETQIREELWQERLAEANDKKKFASKSVNEIFWISLSDVKFISWRTIWTISSTSVKFVLKSMK